MTFVKKSSWPLLYLESCTYNIFCLILRISTFPKGGILLTLRVNYFSNRKVLWKFRLNRFAIFVVFYLFNTKSCVVLSDWPCLALILVCTQVEVCMSVCMYAQTMHLTGKSLLIPKLGRDCFCHPRAFEWFFLSLSIYFISNSQSEASF